MTYLEPKYPLFADISGEEVVVVGAGQVAERKIETLLSYGACVEVIAPAVSEGIEELAAQGRLKLQRRTYQPGDLKQAFLVIGATNDRATNKQVYLEAKENKRLVNVVDIPELCNFYVPSIVSRGPLQIAISTSGAAPTVAKKLRLELSERYGEEWASYVSLLGELRALVLARVPGGEAEHKTLFSRLANSDLYDRIASGQKLEAEAVYKELIEPFIEDFTKGAEL